MAAARAWWLLRYFGHEDVSVLNGGLGAWIAAAHPIKSGEPAVLPEPGDFEARPGGMPLLDAEGALELTRTGVLLDARAGERFLGPHEPIDPVAAWLGARPWPAQRRVLVRLGARPWHGPAPRLGAAWREVLAGHNVTAVRLPGDRVTKRSPGAPFVTRYERSGTTVTEWRLGR